ncbi:MAG: SIS domain-containing protein [Bacteroidetes bacterium]|nr:SIS domain-containing protein [Bacteroidota bacterium]
MNIWGYSEEALAKRGALHTATEICKQPLVWQSVYNSIVASRDQIRSFMDHVLSHEPLQIILTGAGSSAFIGLSLHGTFARNFGNCISSIATTDLVTHPQNYFSAGRPVLLISFSRSGDSPESVAAVSLADQVCSKVFHLIITCDATGKLANLATLSEKYVFVLPPEANDQSLAMTSSYSGMLLAGLLIARLSEIDLLSGQMGILNTYAIKLLDHYANDLRQMADLDFRRAVFLGSGPLYGTATESHLKLQELTDGKIICKNDTFLGFRHGPRAVINPKTLLFYLFSNQAYVAHYEHDLADSIKMNGKALYEAGLMETRNRQPHLDKEFVLTDNDSQLEEDFMPVCCIIPAQMLGFFKSLELGLTPDSPSLSGAISRVVKGVVIYPFSQKA